MRMWLPVVWLLVVLAASAAAPARATVRTTPTLGDLAITIEPGAAEIMDGGYRGEIHLVPQLPVRRYKRHLVWVTKAWVDIDAFFTGLGLPKGDAPPPYRWRGITMKFVRSVGKRTPSAWASKWTISYNVEGSLMTSAAGVRETLFHELFHLNDEQHGDWSGKTLQADYAAIVEKCGTKPKCLAPYAPNNTKVRATGTYYAFQPNNGSGVHEYAAELAVRYWKEQREVAETGRLSHPAFKCGPPENARAWTALVGEFFGGHDAIPAC